MLEYDPARRITTHQALEHDWFKSATDVDILENVKNNFSARQAFRKAVHLVQGVNRMRRNLDNSNGHEK